MYYRRGLTTATTFVRRQVHPSFSHIPKHDSDDTESSSPTFRMSQPGTASLQRYGFHSVTTGFTSSLTRPVGLGFSFQRYMSSRVGEGGEEITDIAEKITDGGYVAEVVGQNPVEVVASQVPAINEVATAAADSALPVALLQYLIDGVHNLSGMNW